MFKSLPLNAKAILAQRSIFIPPENFRKQMVFKRSQGGIKMIH